MAALGLRAWGLGRDAFWIDEIGTLQSVSGTFSSLWQSLTFAPSELGFSNPNTNPPLYFLLLRLWTTVAGLGEAALRWPSALIGAITVPLTFQLGARLGGRGGAWAAAMLTALHPSLVVYSREARPYTLGVLLTLALLEAALRWEEAPERRRAWAGATAACGAALAMTQYVLAPLGFIAAAWVALRRPARRREAAIACAPAGSALLLWEPALAAQFSDGAASFVSHGFRLLTDERPWSSLLRLVSVITGLGATDFFEPFLLSNELGPAYPLILAATAAASALALRDLRHAPLASWFALFGAALLLLDRASPFLYGRYGLFLAPLFAVIAGGACVRTSRPLGLPVFAVLALGWATADLAIATRWVRSQDREIGRFLADVREDRPAYLVLFEGFLRDGLLHSAGPPPKPTKPGPTRIVVLAMKGYLLPDAQLARLLASRLGQRAYRTFSGPGAAGYYFDTHEPERDLATIAGFLAPMLPPFDKRPFVRY